ncbi:uncharacterized protein LOC114519021 [Dendronephthya gigantea]|uniref:uncharacterized protein LOC114519021 n=1 Tax=Dendronephthya gigantea TaxID=151771 RepID=UPI00106B709E|nr:uncharacterized protein LOC114519021 [Dendronephthya gigantea]
MESATDSLLAEVFLNTRNFLMITNALLNPDTDNTVTVLGPYLEMFQSYLKDPHFWQSKVTALKEIMAILLGFFGVIYHWVVTIKPKPGTQIGAGLGLLAGFAFGYALAPARLVTSLFVGIIGGGLIGRGGYDWYREEQQIRMQPEAIQNNNRLMSQRFGRQHEPNDLISAPANASGDLALHVMPEL